MKTLSLAQVYMEKTCEFCTETYIHDSIEVLSACGVSKLQVALDRGTDRDGADAAAAGGAQVLVLFRPQVEQLYEVTGGKQRRVGVEHVQVSALLAVVAKRMADSGGLRTY